MMDEVEKTAVNIQKLTVIIVSFQSIDTIGANLDNLKELADDNFLKVIVVDNNSTDGTADFIENNYSFVKLVRNHENIGFGRGCNCGFKYVETPYILLINPDATIDRFSLGILINFMESNPNVGISGPAVIDEMGALQSSGCSPTPWKVILKPLFPSFATKGMRSILPGETSLSTEWICGAIMMVRTCIIEEIGGFDPRFFLYFEETDLHQRAINAGWQIWTVGKAVGSHLNAESAKLTGEKMMWGTISEHYFRSRFYYFKKHYGLLFAIFAEIGELFTMGLRAFIDLIRGRRYGFLKLRLKAPILKLPTKQDLSVGNSQND